ncbi:MAG: hypothetical protein RLZZ519_3443 [Bacteroidota bacterium]|jgi:hypothetical protein
MSSSLGIASTDNDHPIFIEKVAQILRDRIDVWSPSDIYITKIDSCFDPKWVHFSGKVLGALGLWLKRVTVPPFHPSRVVSSEYYKREDGIYFNSKIKKPLHILQTSEKNMHRQISDFSKDGLFIWYSGSTKQNGIGSLMGYLESENEHFAFYLMLHEDNEWKPSHLIGLTQRELERIFSRQDALKANVL